MRRVALALVLSLASCGGGATSTSPTSTNNTPTRPWDGTWSGPATDSAGASTMTITTTQNGANVTGFVTMVASGLSGSGGLSGLVQPDGTLSVGFNMQGYPSTPCSLTVDGSGVLSADGRSWTLTYQAANNTCGTAVTNGKAILQKQ